MQLDRPHWPMVQHSMRYICQVLFITLNLFMAVSSLIGETANAQLPVTLNSQTTAALTKEVIFDAQFMERSTKLGTTVLRGEVQVIFQGQTLNCDQATIFWDTQTVVAEGHIRLQTPTSYLEAERLELNYKTSQGTLFKGFVRSGQILFEGDVIQRISENEYQTDEAYYTACTTCPPSWSFKGKSIRAEMGRYAYIKQPKLQIGNIPVLWLPYLVVPLKSERQTGVLVPSIFYTGTGGAGVGLPFFWAINRSQDATFTVKQFSLRGTQALTNYRYVLNDNSRGEFDFGTINDKVFPTIYTERLDGRGGKSFQRWFLRYKHFYDLPNNFTQTMDLNLASDLLYPANFPDDLRGGDPALQNRIALTKNSERMHASVKTDYYINLLKTNVFEGNDDSIHRFPEIKYHLAEQRIPNSPFLFKLDSTYSHFTRNDYSYDDVANCPGGLTRCVIDSKLRDGKYDSRTDFIRTGQRIDIQPALAYPIQASRFLEVVPSVNYRYTQYSFGVQDTSPDPVSSSPSRQYAQMKLEMRSSMSRLYQFSQDEKADRYKHLMQFGLVGSGIPKELSRESKHPFFGNSQDVSATQASQPLSNEDFQAGGRGIQFDTFDQVSNRQTVTLSVDNSITRKRWFNNQALYQQIARFRLAQSYDFNEARKAAGAQPYSAISGLAEFKFDYFNTNTTVDYFPYLNVSNISSRIRLLSTLQNYVEFLYNSVYVIPAKSNTFTTATRTENIGLGVGAHVSYFDVGTQIDYSLVTRHVNGWTVYNTIAPPGNCWLIRTSLQRVPNSKDFTVKFNFEFNFGGETT